LYMLSTESATKVTCTGQCATIWPPLTVTAVPAFGKGVSQSLVGQVTRSDGSHQLTYGGHPLYTFSFDKAPHQTNGEGIHSFGGTWSVLSASTGKPVAKGGASSSSSTSTTTYGAGY
ncbi:MAG: COG4315 family predicted lipoprotein, partial [Acidimicrobiales bacterium]